MRLRSYVPILIVIVCGFAISGHAQTRSVQTHQPAWEYKVLVYTTAGDASTLYEDGKLVASNVSGPLDRANVIGQQGWELVGIVATQETTPILKSVRYYWFKRPK
jgi:hypothetical protein